MDWQITRFTRLDPCSLYRFRFWFRSQYHCTTSNPHSTNPHANFHIFHPISSLVTSFWKKNTFLKKLHVTLQPFPTIYGTTIYTLLTDGISKPVSQWRPFDGNEGIDGNRLRMFRQCGQSVEESNASVWQEGKGWLDHWNLLGFWWLPGKLVED